MSQSQWAAGLPTDLLTQVFIHLEGQDAFACSHVCKRWRNIAINAPQLWTTLVDPPALTTVVRYARNYTVALEVCPKSKAEYANLCDALERILHKLHALDIYLYSPAASSFDLEGLWKALSRPAPNLTRLCIKNDFRLPDGEIPVRQRATLFASYTGRLETLVLGGFRVAGTVPAFAGVRELDIEAHCFDGYTSLAAQFPAVRKLAVHNIWARRRNGEPGHAPDHAPKRLPPHVNDLMLHFGTGQPTEDVRTCLRGCDIGRVRHLQAVNAEALALGAVPSEFRARELQCLAVGRLVEVVLSDNGLGYSRTALVGRGELHAILGAVNLEHLRFAQVDVRFLSRSMLDLGGCRRLKNLEVVFPPRPTASEFGERAIQSMPRLDSVIRLVLQRAEAGAPVFLHEENVLQFVRRVTPKLEKLGVPAGVSVSGFETLYERGLDILRT